MPKECLAKPQLRDLHLTSVKRSIIVSSILALATCLSFKFFVTDVQEKKIEDFYKTYDPLKALEIMNNAGLMQSCPKD